MDYWDVKGFLDGLSGLSASELLMELNESVERLHCLIFAVSLRGSHVSVDDVDVKKLVSLCNNLTLLCCYKLIGTTLRFLVGLDDELSKK